jgi:ribosomal-protein-alanine N-acetyltransferase
VRAEDVEAYREAVEMSRVRLARWNPVDPDDIVRHLAAQSDVHRTFLVFARDARGAHGVVGKINVTNVVRGRFQSGSLGYDSYDPYAGRGLFREGLGLVVGVAFTAADRGGMGLHRVEASVQPGNVASAGVLRSLGFRHEGFTPRMLRLGGPDGREDWRDHERFAVTADEWPAKPYAPQERRRLVVLVNGLPGSGKTTLATDLAEELGLPLLSGACEPTWALLSGSPAGAVVECAVPRESLGPLRSALRGAGVDPASVVEVCTDEATALGLGPVLSTDTFAPLSRGAVVRLALAARAASATA